MAKETATKMTKTAGIKSTPRQPEPELDATELPPAPLDESGELESPQKPEQNQDTAIIEIPISDALTGGHLDALPRFISGTGLSRNTLAKEGLRRVHRALSGRYRLSTGRVVESRSEALQWVLERIAEAETG